MVIDGMKRMEMLMRTLTRDLPLFLQMRTTSPMAYTTTSHKARSYETVRLTDRQPVSARDS